MSCHGGSCSCGKGSQSSVQENPTLVQMSTSRGVLSTHDFMKGLGSLTVDEEVVEIRFKNNRKAFYRNRNGLSLNKDERVVVEVDGGDDLGTVSLTGGIADKQFEQKTTNGIKVTAEEKKRYKSGLKRVNRIATQADIGRWLGAKKRERSVLVQSRQLAADLGLEMSITDVEFQGDGRKVTVYYTAETSVDFRELIRIYGYTFLVNIQMRQISSTNR